MCYAWNMNRMLLIREQPKNKKERLEKLKYVCRNENLKRGLEDSEEIS